MFDDADDPLRCALLIDADNVNLEVVAEVMRRLAKPGRRLQHRRAYGSLAKAQEFARLCQEQAIRFLPTTFAGTNGTDIALAIDAIELMINEPVDEIALVTSDCDFLPLVARLREMGAVVLGFGQRGKSARDLDAEVLRVYDEFSVIDGTPPAKPRAAPKRGAAAAPRAAASKVLPLPGPLPPPAQPAPAVPSVALLHPPEEDEVRRIVELVPALLEGKKVELGTAAQKLREAGLLAKSAPSTKLFRKYPDRFELTPARQPNKVLYKPR